MLYLAYLQLLLYYQMLQLPFLELALLIHLTLFDKLALHIIMYFLLVQLSFVLSILFLLYLKFPIHSQLTHLLLFVYLIALVLQCYYLLKIYITSTHLLHHLYFLLNKKLSFVFHMVCTFVLMPISHLLMFLPLYNMDSYMFLLILMILHYYILLCPINHLLYIKHLVLHCDMFLKLVLAHYTKILDIQYDLQYLLVFLYLNLQIMYHIYFYMPSLLDLFYL